MSHPRFHLFIALLGGASAGTFNQDRAIEYAKFAGAAYCSAQSLESWSCGPKCTADVTSVKICPGHTVRAWLGIWEDKCLVSFQGTNDTAAFVADAEVWHADTNWDICGNCKVHGGFLGVYNDLAPCVKDTLKELGCGYGSPIRTTGHSLGAAVNCLAMLDLHASGWYIEESYDFGKPRTGDHDFAQAWNEQFSERAWRVTHAKDPVPNVPPDNLLWNWHMEHVEPEVWYPGDVSDGYQICTIPHDDDHCAEQNWNVPLDLFHVDDHLDYMGVHTGSDGCDNGDIVV